MGRFEHKWMIFAVTSMANIVVAFAINSTNLALPVMAGEFGVSMGAISWLSLVYSLIPSCTLLAFGRLGDLFGYKKQFIGGFVVLGLASLLLPLLAVTLGMLIFFRCLQALGYSMLISITQAMCNRAFPAQERGRALGINSVFVSVGLASGPTIGGILLTHFSWRAIFYFNLPFCILGAIAALLVLQADQPAEKEDRHMDWPGSFLFSLFIGSLAVAINFSYDWGLASPRFLACLLGSGLALVLFIFRESHASAPLMALGLFKSKTFSLANVACLFSYMIQQMTTFLAPFFLMDILLLSKSSSGFIMLANPLAMMLLSPVGGAMADKRGSRRPALIGLGMIGAGCMLMSRLGQNAATAYVVIALICYGIGNGLSVPAINAAIFSAVPRAHSGVASGMVATMRNLGQGLGVAFGGAIIALRQAAYLGRRLGAQEAYLLAQRDAFYFGLAIIAGGILCMSFIPQPKQR